MKKVLVSLLCLVSLVAKAQISDEIYYSETPPFKSLFIENYSEEQARAYLDSAMIDIWEGIWEFIRHETVVCIERFSDDHFSAQFTHRIILLHSEKYTGIPTGTVIGYLTKSGSRTAHFVGYTTSEWAVPCFIPNGKQPYYRMTIISSTFSAPEKETDTYSEVLFPRASDGYIPKWSIRNTG